MHNRLTPIIAQKQQEVAVLETLLQMQPHHPIAQIVQRKIRRNSKKSFSQALRQSHLAVIAEIKRKSPSKGALATIADPLALAQTYIAGGAKNHAVIMPDADIAQAADAIAGAAFGSAGQRCMALSVAVAVGDQVADQLAKLIAEKAKAIVIGPGDKAGVDMGPLSNAELRDKVKHYIDIGVEEGAQLLVDGRTYRNAEHPNGFYLGASVFDHVQPGMRIYEEEIFGPVLCIVRVPDAATALDLINKHQYGNGTAIFTRDGDSAREFARQVKVGMIGINVPIPVPVAYHSFGGWKRSLFGDIHMHGPEGFMFNTKLKTITARWPTGIRAQSAFVMPVHE
jgi:malonate-semialdehyde dehydrogenase (acetylating)/methylmalonate-semialdehyde dehydrogenase